MSNFMKAIGIVAVTLALAGGGLVLAQRAGWINVTRPAMGDHAGSETMGANESCPHTLVANECPFCTPSLIESKGFCNGHGVPEALCHLCAPSIIPAFKAKGDWCAEHDAPESLCPVCSPTLDKTDAQKPLGASLPPLFDGLEILRAAELPGFGELSPVECDTESMRVRLAPGMSERIGLTLAEARSEGFTEQHRFNATIDYDRNRLAAVSPRAPGVIAEVFKEIGDPARKDEVLAVIGSVAIGNAKAELLQAAALVNARRKDHEREQRLLERGVSTEKDSLAAEAALVEASVALSRARQALRNLGLSDGEIDGVRASGDTGSRLMVTAPFDGVVIERNAALGEVVDVSTPLFRVADTSRMWGMIDVYETELERVRLGQPVTFSPDSLKDRRFAGTIAWISSAVDPQTRTLRARVDLPNPDRLLKANMFGRAEVTVRDGRPALVVPKEAVQWEGCCHIVFERQSEMMYVPRRVRLGHALKDHYEIEAGLEEGARVVAGGSFLLKTEIMKSSIGAGCCEIEPAARIQ
jgi:cobalt-zinc-cadmium efflux system membrane fusion protein